MKNEKTLAKVSSQDKYFAGFAGFAGIGKSTLAHLISDWCNGVVTSYAKPLKESLIVLTGLNTKYFYDIEFKEKTIPELNITPRKMMQLFGTEFVREMIHNDFWIWRMKQEILKYSENHLFIDDIRFENEAKLVRDNGGIIIHLNRKYEKVTNENDHASEKSINVHKLDVVYDISKQSPILSASHIINMLEEL